MKTTPDGYQIYRCLTPGYEDLRLKITVVALPTPALNISTYFYRKGPK